MQKILVDIDDILEVVARPVYGVHVFIVDGDGRYRIEWQAEFSEVWGAGEYGAIIPQFDYDDHTAVAQGLVDDTEWFYDYIAEWLYRGCDPGFDAVSYAMTMLPSKWHAAKVQYIWDTAVLFLESLNTLADDPWGYDAGSGGYIPLAPPFTVEWFSA